MRRERLNRINVGWGPVLGLLLTIAREDVALGSDTDSDGRIEPLLTIEHGADLTKEAESLAQNLATRLRSSDVRIALMAKSEKTGDEMKSSDEQEDKGQKSLWVVHLVRLLDDRILIAVDNVDGDGRYDLVKEVQRSDDPAETAWTMALIVEEAVVPYLTRRQAGPSLGAGLAIIEPPVVAGVKKKPAPPDKEFPRLRSFGAGLAGCWIGAMDEIVAGPRLSIDGLLAPKVVAGLGLAWAGTGRMKKEVDGSFYEIDVSHLPLDLLFGFAALKSRVVDLTAYAGVSAGFTIYHSALRGGPSRTDLLFAPWAQARIEAAIHVYGPLTLCVGGGAAVAIVRDVLSNAGNKVYVQSRWLPLFGVSAQIWI